jgi:SAM-dependent methyltransferase
MTSPAPDATGSSLYGRRVTPTIDGRPLVAVPHCPVCETVEAVPLYDIEATPGRLVQCPTCGTGRVSPLPDGDELSGYYSSAYYGESGRKFNRFLEAMIRFIAARHLGFLARRVPPGGRVLDIGCGRGTLLSGLADRGLEVHGTEISEAAANGADPRAQIRIAPTLAAAGYPDDYFDQVIIWHVLEHLPNPRETLQEIHRILRPGGEVIVAVPNFSSWQAEWAGPAWFHLDLPRHLYHFPGEALKSMLADCGFSFRSEHHFSLRQNPFGWVQSWLNRWPSLPRNGLYEMLLRQSKSRPTTSSGFARMVCYVTFLAGLLVGVLIELAATVCRRGATVHVVAAKRMDGSPPS